MAEILPFPLARRRDLVCGHAEAMARTSAAAADKYLIEQLEVIWDDLELQGFPCSSIEREVISLGRAVRAELWHLIIATPGGAA